MPRNQPANSCSGQAIDCVVCAARLQVYVIISTCSVQVSLIDLPTMICLPAVELYWRYRRMRSPSHYKTISFIPQRMSICVKCVLKMEMTGGFMFLIYMWSGEGSYTCSLNCYYQVCDSSWKVMQLRFCIFQVLFLHQNHFHYLSLLPFHSSISPVILVVVDCSHPISQTDFVSIGCVKFCRLEIVRCYVNHCRPEPVRWAQSQSGDMWIIVGWSQSVEARTSQVLCESL